jgi:RES domain
VLILPPAANVKVLLWHITHARHRDKMLHFGKSNNNRFDDPQGNYGTLYVSPDLTTAFLESVLHDKKLATPKDRMLTRRFLADYVVKPILLPEPLELADLSASYALANLGYNNDLLTARHGYNDSKALSQTLYKEMPNCDGLVWHSRQGGNTDCIALFERCKTKLEYSPPDIDLLDHPHFPNVERDLHLTILI